MSDDKRLIEDYLPIEAISKEASREKSVRKGHISTLHLWWARRTNESSTRSSLGSGSISRRAGRAGRGAEPVTGHKHARNVRSRNREADLRGRDEDRLGQPADRDAGRQAGVEWRVRARVGRRCHARITPVVAFSSTRADPRNPAHSSLGRSASRAAAWRSKMAEYRRVRVWQSFRGRLRYAQQ